MFTFEVKPNNMLRDVYDLGEICFPKVETSIEFLQKAYAKSSAFIITENNVLIGIISWEKAEDGLYINTLMVRPNYQRKGIGTNFINLVLEKAKEKNCSYVIVHTKKDTEFMDFYKKLGFNPYGEDEEDFFLVRYL